MRFLLSAISAVALLASPVFAQAPLDAKLSSAPKVKDSLVEFEMMTWPEVKAALAAGKTTALFYTGGTEQRGPQNVNGGHNLMARATVNEIALRLGNAIALPVLPYSPNEASAELPGTIGLTGELLGAILERISEQAITTGFKNIILMGDHGGGQPKIYADVARKLDEKYAPSGIHVYYCDEVYKKAQDDFNSWLLAHGYPRSAHAGIPDTSEMLYLGGDEGWVRKELIKDAVGDPVPEPGQSAADALPHRNNGISGDARRSTPDLGKMAFDMKVEYAVKQIQGFLSNQQKTAATTFYVPLSAQELSPSDQAAADAAIKVIRPEAIAAHMRFLSDALLEGRGTGERGHEIAARYVAAELESVGLAPAGVNGTWFQPLPLRKAELVPEKTSFELVRDGKSQKLVLDQDYVIYANLLLSDTTVDARAVFVGYGVTAPEFQYDDYAGADVKGKVAVILRGAPARFPSTERAYFASALTAQQNAAAHGAVGVIVIDSPEFLRAQWNRIMLQLRADPPMRWLDPQGAASDTVPEIRVLVRTNQSGAEALFAGAPKSLPEVFAAAKADKPGSFSLPGTVRIHLANRFTRVESRNVIAKLAGSDPNLANEYVVYSAHLDHLGICRPGEADPICHGASDNASGTGALLEIARAFASLPRAPRRSILFLFVTGEERGLLGSDYFAHYPTVPLENILADVNIDGAPGLRFPIKDIVPQGADHSTLSKDVEAAARTMGYAISPDPRPEEGFFTRSDQYSFVRRGVPSVKIDGGIQSTDPAIDGATLARNWTASNYHTPNDNMSHHFYFDSAAKSTALNFLIGYEVAEQSERPAWNAGDFFGTKFAHKQ